ncbi:hypothetical protein K8I61_11885 [bacterium]|nr:hypothetical protein [bacterium]
MKMLMIIVDDKFRDTVEVLLEEHAVVGFTEIPTAFGEGMHGKKFASRLHPGANSIVFSIVTDTHAESIKEALVGACRRDPACEKPIHIATMNVEEFI